MKTLSRTIGLALACTFLTLLCACGGNPAANDSGSTAMGRYVEAALPLPEEVSPLHFALLDDGTLQFAGVQAQGSSWQIGVWRSADGGQSWQALDEPWVKQLPDYSATALTMDSAGDIWFAYDEYAPGWEDIDGYWPESKLAKVEDGAIVEQKISLNSPEYFEVLENGDFIAAYYTSLSLIDGQTGEERYSLESASRLIQGTFFAQNGKLYVSDGELLKVYSLATGEPLDELPFSVDTTRSTGGVWDSSFAGRTGVSPCADGAFCYVNTSGIYRMTADGSLTEKVVDGTLCALSSPSADVLMALPGDGIFWALFQDGQYNAVLKSYTYDASVPTTPGTQLTVWTLEDSPTLRQAAAAFQRQNPDVMVDLQVGVVPDSGVLPSDAINSLVASMLAGDGPDVLLLDGLPASSWQEKGMLAELTTLVDAEALNGLLPNLRSSLAPEGGPVYTLPARFTVPFWYGDEENLVHTQSPAALADFLQQQPSPMTGLVADNMIDILYPLYQDRWFGENGQLQKEVLKQDLADLARITALYEGKEIPGFNDPIINAAYYAKGAYPISLSTLSGMDELCADYTIKTDETAISFPNLGDEDPANQPSALLSPVLEPAQNTAGSVFYPSVLLGVSADSDKQELAGQFITCALSPEVQAYNLHDGLPVNEASLLSQQQPPAGAEDSGRYYMSYGASYTNPFLGAPDEFVVLNCLWPTEAYFKQATAVLKGLDTPVYTDRVVRDILAEETLPYLNGQRSLDETMAALSQKLDLYIAEAA